MLPIQLLIAAFGGWLHREQADVIAFLRKENRVLKARLAGQRLRFDDDDGRRCLATSRLVSSQEQLISGGDQQS